WQSNWRPRQFSQTRSPRSSTIHWASPRTARAIGTARSPSSINPSGSARMAAVTTSTSWPWPTGNWETKTKLASGTPRPSRGSTTKAAGGVLTAKQAPHRPGTAPALGLRAGDNGLSWYRRPCSENGGEFSDWLEGPEGRQEDEAGVGSKGIVF